MKALSIRQPWLWAILDIPEGYCPKRVENRKGTAFHGVTRGCPDATPGPKPGRKAKPARNMPLFGGGL